MSKEWEQINPNIKRRVRPDAEAVYKYVHPKDAFKKEEQNIVVDKEEVKPKQPKKQKGVKP